LRGPDKIADILKRLKAEAKKARADRDEAMERVEKHASPEWKAAAQAAVFKAATELEFLTSEDVIRRIDPKAKTHTLKALGPTMKSAAKDGWIVKANKVVPALRRRMTPINVWKSLIYAQPV